MSLASLSSSHPSYDDLGSWLDLDTTLPDADGEESTTTDPRTVDPRQTPPDIAQLDKSIHDLEQKVAELKLERAKLLDAHSLISRLPPELLSRVFELCVDETVDVLPDLSVVSRLWRHVVLSTPTIWTYIILDSEWGWRIPAFLRQLRAHIQRSQTSKLFVNIDLRYMPSTADTELVMSELEPHLWRCYSYNVSVPDWHKMRTVQEHSSGLGQSLEHLHLRLDYSDSETHEPFSVLTQPCPLLSHVMLEHTPLDCIGVPLPALRQLSLLRDRRCHSSAKIAYPFRDVLDILAASPLQSFTLRSALFTVDSIEDVFKATLSPIELPALTSLIFDAVDSGSVSIFLDSTSLPAMELLSVNSGEDMEWLTKLSLSSSRYPSLRLLNLRNCNFHAPALASLVRALHNLPQIEGLGISSPATGLVGTRIFEVMAYGPDVLGSWLLPRLKALSIQDCGDLSGHELLRVVTARRDAAEAQVANITYLKITHCYSVNREVLERLTALVHTVHTYQI